MTPIISGSDFRIVLAPAISVEKNVTVKNSTVSENVLVCGWSLEFNVVTDVDCFVNKKQVFLDDILNPKSSHEVGEKCGKTRGREEEGEARDVVTKLRASFLSSSLFVQVLITENWGVINGFYTDISSSYFQSVFTATIFNIFICVYLMRSKAAALLTKVDIGLVSVTNFNGFRILFLLFCADSASPDFISRESESPVYLLLECTSKR